MIIDKSKLITGLVVFFIGFILNPQINLGITFFKKNPIEQPEKKDLENFKKDLITGNKKGKNWSLKPLPQTSKEPLVDGLPKGKYFIIDIKNPRADEIIYFEAGEYIISNFDSKFRDGLINFAQEVLDIVEGKTDYKIFVQGSADIAGHESFIGEQKMGFLYETVYYLPMNKSIPNTISFYNKADTQSIPTKFKNTHLPNLRGRFIKESFHNTFDTEYNEPVILEGEVTSIINDKDRNAVLLLYLSDDFFLSTKN